MYAHSKGNNKVNNPKTLTEFLSRRKACEGCTTKKFSCVPYQLLFLDMISELQFHECPCISCIVKVVCEQCCIQFDEFIDEHIIIINSRTLPAIEYIILYYREINKHLLKFQVDPLNVTRISDVYSAGMHGRKLTEDEEDRVKYVSERFRK